MKNLHIVFDMSNMVYRAYYALRQPDLTDSNNRRLLVKQVITDCCSIARLVSHHTNTFFCFDGDQNFRKQVDLDYKGSRKGIPGIDLLITEVEALLVFKQANVVRHDHLEADDCIALLCERYETHNKFIITGDKDITQLIRPRVFVMPPVNSKRVVYCTEGSQEIAKKHFPHWPTEIVDPDYVLFEKILKGCTSDNVTGLGRKGMRKKKVAEITDAFRTNLFEKQEEEFDALYNAVAWDTHSSVNDVKKQLQLVCLQSTYMPKEGVEYILNQDLREDFILRDTFDLLSNTLY